MATGQIFDAAWLLAKLSDSKGRVDLVGGWRELNDQTDKTEVAIGVSALNRGKMAAW
jgi:hypothetical protein